MGKDMPKKDEPKKFSVIAPPELWSEIERMREAFGHECGIEPRLSQFAAAAIRKGLAEMQREGIGQ
jgi:hypothetical protein